jgi:hypothetical protein
MKNVIFYFNTSDFSFNNFYGYANLKDFEMSLYLYYASIKKQREFNPLKFILITDEDGIVILNKYNLDFDEIRIVEISEKTKYEILLQKDSFFIVDFDVILFNKLPLYLYNSDIIVKEVYEDNNPTLVAKTFLSNFNELNSQIKYGDEIYELIKEDVLNNKKINSLCSSIFGGENLSLIEEYVLRVNFFKEKNKMKYEDFFRSIYSYYFFKQKGINVTPVIDNNLHGKYMLNPFFRNYVIQLTKQTKKNDLIIGALEELLKEYYPRYYTKLKT